MKDRKIKVSFRVSQKVIDAVEKRYEGKNRSKKFEQAIREGYDIITKKN